MYLISMGENCAYPRIVQAPRDAHRIFSQSTETTTEGGGMKNSEALCTTATPREQGRRGGFMNGGGRQFPRSLPKEIKKAIHWEQKTQCCCFLHLEEQEGNSPIDLRRQGL